MDQPRSFIPLLGGASALLGSAWHLYSSTNSQYSPSSLLFRAFSQGPRVPLRQRVIQSAIATTGLPLSETEGGADDNFELSDFMTDLESVSSSDQAASTRGRKDGAQPLPTWEFSMAPLRLVLRAIPAPIVGLLDVVVERAKPVLYTVVSLVYQSLPLTSLARVSRELRIVPRSESFRFSTIRIRYDFEAKCDDCGAVYKEIDGRAGRARWFGSRCHHAYTVYIGETNSLRWFVDDLDSPQWLPRPSQHIWSRLPNRSRRLRELLGVLADAGGCDCHVGLTDRVQPRACIPEPTPDGLFTLSGSKVWRSAEKANGVRCTIHYPNSMHSWNPAILKAIKKFDAAAVVGRFTPSEYDSFRDTLFNVYAMIRLLSTFVTPGDTYYVLSITSDRLPELELPEGGGRFIIITDSIQTSDRVLMVYPHLQGGDHLVVNLPVVGGMVSYAGWRFVLAAVCPVKAKFHIINANRRQYTALACTLVRKRDISLSSCEIGHVYPVYMGNCLIHTTTLKSSPYEVAMLFWLCGWAYGWDEIVPSLLENPTVVLTSDPGLPPIMAPIVTPNWPRNIIVTFVLVSSSGRFVDSYTSDFTREAVFLMSQLMSEALDTGRISLATALADPRPITDVGIKSDLLTKYWHEVDQRDNRFRSVNLAGENILSEVTTAHGGLIFFTFGSRGDVNPIMAHAKRLASYGARVTVIKLNTEEEGKLLASVSNENVGSNLMLFSRARDYLASWDHPGKITPYQLMDTLSVTYTLAPPDDIIHPFVASGNPLVAMAYSLLGWITAPTMRIGAFSTSKTLPTSVDGENFLKPRYNEGKKGSTLAWWGGDNAPPQGYEHIELAPSVDHQEVFYKYETIYTSGTVGTVALASVSGCKVVVVGGGLDREYKDPYDAGAGFISGQAPDNIFLALGAVHSAYYGLWLRHHWYDVRGVWAWLGPYDLGLFSFRVLIYYLYMTKVYKATFLSTTPLSTILMFLDGRASLSITTYAFYIALAKVVDTILLLLDKNYIWLANRFIDLNIRMISSAAAFWVAQRRGLGAALVVTWLLTPLDMLINWVVAWVVATFVEAAPLPLDDEYGVLELVMVYKWIPVIHIALVFPQHESRLEGAVNPFGLYQATLVRGGFHSAITFPTKVRFSSISKADVNFISLPYGVTWNCYQVILNAVSPCSHRLGIAAPFVFFVDGLCTIVSFVALVAISITYTVVSIVPSFTSITTRSSGIMAMLGRTIKATVAMVESHSSRLSLTYNVWFARLTYLIPAPQWLYR